MRHIAGHCSRIPEQLRKITGLRSKEIAEEKSLGSKKDEFLGRELTWNLSLKKRPLNLLLCQKQKSVSFYLHYCFLNLVHEDKFQVQRVNVVEWHLCNFAAYLNVIVQV